MTSYPRTVPFSSFSLFAFGYGEQRNCVSMGVPLSCKNISVNHGKSVKCVFIRHPKVACLCYLKEMKLVAKISETNLLKHFTSNLAVTDYLCLFCIQELTRQPFHTPSVVLPSIEASCALTCVSCCMLHVPVTYSASISAAQLLLAIACFFVDTLMLQISPRILFHFFPPLFFSWSYNLFLHNYSVNHSL